MPTPILKKIKYSDDQRAIIDAINKNFASLEFLLANGKLDGVNINSKYVGKVAAETIETMSLTVGENVNIGEATKTFVTQLADETPTPPYHTGDNWVNVFDGNLYTCLFSRESGEFSMSDWIYSSQYVQPSGVTTIVDGVVTTDFVNALGITANSVKSNWVYAGNISAGQIKSGKINGSLIEVDDYLYMNTNKHNKGIYLQGFNDMYVRVYDPGGTLEIGPGIQTDDLTVVNSMLTWADIKPRYDDDVDLGSSSRRWGYVYTTKLNVLSNAGINGMISSVGTRDNTVTGSTLKVNSNGWFGVDSSSKRRKENIKPHEFNYSSIMGLEVVSFNFKKEFCNDQSIQYGVIAEQALEVGLHELVGYDDKGNVDYFAYEKLSLACLQLIQEQDKKIKELERKIESLEKEVVE